MKVATWSPDGQLLAFVDPNEGVGVPRSQEPRSLDVDPPFLETSKRVLCIYIYISSYMYIYIAMYILSIYIYIEVIHLATDGGY